MAFAADGDDSTPLSPDGAFSVLGNEIRIQILQTLGEANGSLSFTELRNRIGLRRGGQFNYHLDQLVGHFVSKSEDGYALRRQGSRIVQALLSGAVTEDPRIKPTLLDNDCYHCGAPVLLKYSEHLAIFCSNCGGNFQLPADLMSNDAAQFSGVDGYLGGYEIPPAGIKGRSLAELFRAATTWANVENLTASADLCPRCSAKIKLSVLICESHGTTDEICSDCNARQRVQLSRQCQNCPYARLSFISRGLLANTDFLNFITDHGLNPVDSDSPWHLEALLATPTEDIRSIEPFEARFTFTIDDDSITLTVDNNLAVVEATRSRASP